MEEFFKRHLEYLIGRIDGPMWIRIIIQPLVAAIIGLRSAAKDFREGRPSYYWSLIADKARRHALLMEGWKEIAKVFVVAVAIDMIYQLAVLRWVYPLQSVVVASVLALLPYVVVRGFANWIVSLCHSGRTKNRSLPVSRKPV